MAKEITNGKQCTVNPLKMSQPLGAALAFLGMDRCLPLFHGSQGCTSFGLVVLVRHFREAIPLQTTAMNEVNTVLGGFENLEAAILNIVKRTSPKLIGICTTGITEVKGDDIGAFVKTIRTKHTSLKTTALVEVSTPDFAGSLQDGWARAVTRMIEQLVEPMTVHQMRTRQVNVLPGSHLTPGDIDELRDVFESFSLDPVFLPDLSGSLDGHIPEHFTPTSLGGCALEDVRTMGQALHTVALGAQMQGAAITLESRTGVPYTLFDRLTGLGACDEFISFLSRLSGVPVPRKYRRQRAQLVDAMLDAHFNFGGKHTAVAAEPDMLWTMTSWLAEMGCVIQAAVTTTQSPLLDKIPADEVVIGDLDDLEARAASADLLVTNSQGRHAADRLGIPLYRVGLPIFDRLGAAHRVTAGYRGTRDLVFHIGNQLMNAGHEPTPGTWSAQRGADDPAETAIH